MKFGDRLKYLRTSLNISQEKLGILCGVSRSTIANYEVNRNFPDDAIKYKLCEIFNCTMDYLMCRTDERAPQNTLNLTEKDIAFIKNIKRLDNTNKMIIENTMEALLDKQEKDEKKED